MKACTNCDVLQVEQPLLRELYDAYSFNVIPKIGGLVANDEASYQYLVESIRQFPDQVGS
jgi:ubiquinone/menaquinone biosynthesis C-methylase UbiE